MTSPMKRIFGFLILAFPIYAIYGGMVYDYGWRKGTLLMLAVIAGTSITLLTTYIGTKLLEK